MADIKHAVLNVELEAGDTVAARYDAAKKIRKCLLGLSHMQEAFSRVSVLVNGSVSINQLDEIAHFQRTKTPYSLDVCNPGWESRRSIVDAVAHVRQATRDISGSICLLSTDDVVPSNDRYSFASVSAFENVQRVCLDNSAFYNQAVIENIRPAIGQFNGEFPDSLPLSVLLPVHAGVPAIQFAQALDSVIFQDVPPKEIVVSVDGPLPDESRQVIKSRKTMFENKGNGGSLKIVDPQSPTPVKLSRTLNVGMEGCTQPYVARMDSDDVCLPHRLKTQWEHLQRKKSIGEHVDVLSSGVNYFENDPSEIDCTIIPPEHNEALQQHLKETYTIFHPTVVFDRHYIQGLDGYDPQCVVAQDNDLWQRAILDGATFSSVQEPLLQYRVTEEQDERRKQAFGDVLPCYRRALKQGWIDQAKFDSVVEQYKKSVVATPYEERKIVRRHKIHREPDGNRVPVGENVLKSATLDM